jgi:hypothetical protein
MAQAQFDPWDPASNDPYDWSAPESPVLRQVDPTRVTTAAQNEAPGFQVPTQTLSPFSIPTNTSPVTTRSGAPVQSAPLTLSGVPNGNVSPLNRPFTGNLQDLWNQYRQANPSYRPTQAGATSLQPFVDWARSQGANISIASPSSGGYVKGITDPTGQFIKLLDGYDNPTWLPGGDAPSLTAGVGDQLFTDPATQMFQQMVLNRIDQLLQSVNRPEVQQYRDAALKRVDELTNQPAYTPADEAALITQMREPLTQARDARISFNKEQMGGRNIGPSSGLFQDQVYNTPERDYERALGTGTNDLAVRGIQETQARKQQALDILANLVGLGSNVRAEDNAQADKALTTGAILPDLTAQRLQLLMQTLGMSTSQIPSLLSTLTSLNGQNIGQQQFQAGQQQMSAQQWGALIGQLVNSPLLNPSTWRT